MLWGIAMSVVMGWVARSRMKQRPEQLATHLRHPVSTLVLGVVGFLFFAGIAVVSNTIGKNNTTSVWTTLVFLFFAMMSLAMVAEYYLARHRLISDGLQYGSLLGRRREIKWVDVRSIEYATVMKWFKVTTNQGTTVRISVMLMGLPTFAQQALSHIPGERITEPTRSILVETANGKPPSVWD
jgi:hypothetical protein